MKSGYHQIVIEERQKEMTSFTVGPLGFNEVLPSKCPCNLPEVARAVTCIIKYATLIFILMISYVFSKTQWAEKSGLTLTFEHVTSKSKGIIYSFRATPAPSLVK